jgi:hypothetical protein
MTVNEIIVKIISDVRRESMKNKGKIAARIRESLVDPQKRNRKMGQ